MESQYNANKPRIEGISLTPDHTMRRELAALLEAQPEWAQAQASIDGITIQVTHEPGRLARLPQALLTSAAVPLLQLVLGLLGAMGGIYLTMWLMFFIGEQGWVPSSLHFLSVPTFLLGLFGGLAAGMRLPNSILAQLLKLRTTSSLHIGRHAMTLSPGGGERRIPFSEVLFIDATSIVLRSRERVAFGEAYSTPSRKWLVALLKASLSSSDTGAAPDVPATLRALQEHTRTRDSRAPDVTATTPNNTVRVSSP